MRPSFMRARWPTPFTGRLLASRIVVRALMHAGAIHARVSSPHPQHPSSDVRRDAAPGTRLGDASPAPAAATLEEEQHTHNLLL